jgi:uncharacterized protein (TIGR02001 family)
MSKLAIAVGAVVLSGTAAAEFAANIGVTSNYVWRGVTQTDDDAAVSGGVDYSHDSGFYAGVWASNVNFPSEQAVFDSGPDNIPGTPDDVQIGTKTSNNRGAEVDFYAGFANEFDMGLGYDVGLLYYWYPGFDDFGGDEDELDFTEIYGSLSFGPVSGGVHYTVDTEAGGDDSNWYYYLGASFDVAPTWSVGGTVGSYDFDDGFDYKHAQLDLSKDAGDFGTFTLTVSKVFDNDEDDDGEDVYDDDALVFVSWGKSF